MAYKTILTHVQNTPAAALTLDSAVALTRDLDATLLGLGAEMIPPSGVADPTGLVEGQWAAMMREQIEKNLHEAERVFTAAASGVPNAWVRSLDLPARALARAARAADLIVVASAPHPTNAYRDCDVGELAITSGRPVLVVPPSGGRLKADRIVVAWKDSREARRAVSDALPLLKRAQEVEVLQVYQGDAEEADYQTSDVVEALLRHGVKARARSTEAADDCVSRELYDAAVAIGADLVVSGAYGHNRLSEWAFGGVTRALLGEREHFLLLSH